MWDKWTRRQAGRHGCQQPLHATCVMHRVAFALWSRWGGHSRDINAWFFPIGGIKVGGRCTGRAELGPQRQPHAAASSSSFPTGSCRVLGCGHWEVASSVFPSNELVLESVGCEPQTEILLSCVLPKSAAPPGVALHGEGTGGFTGRSAAGLWAGSAWLPPSPPRAPST